MRRVSLALLLLLALPLTAAAEKLDIYTWQGFGGGSNLHNPKFTPRWKVVLEGKGDTLVIDDKPNAEKLLAALAKAHIVYGSTHSGVPKGGTEQGLQVGDKGSGKYVLGAAEIAAAKPRAQLVIINGCSTFPLLEEKDGAVRNLATAFGINAGTKGKVYLGFVGVHGGPKGDSFFRVFFYFWMGAGGTDLTVVQALDKAKEFITDQVARQGGDKAQEFFLSTGAANIRGDDLQVLGDVSLRYKDLKP